MVFNYLCFAYLHLEIDNGLNSIPQIESIQTLYIYDDIMIQLGEGKMYDHNALVHNFVSVPIFVDVIYRAFAVFG